MYRISEKLNSSIPSTAEMMRKNDTRGLLELIISQKSADCIDINTELCGGDRVAMMTEVAELCIRECGCDIMIDSPDEQVLAAVLPIIRARRVIVNSVTLTERIDALLEPMAKFGAGVVALPISGGRVPSSAAERVENAKKLYARLIEGGIKSENIYIDALSEAVATNPDAGKITLETVKGIKAEIKVAHIVCGLSNTSFGLPKRGFINAAALELLTAAGMDAAIMNVTASGKTCEAAKRVFLGEDEYAIEYIGLVRSNSI